MASYNKVVIMGNITRDPELRYTPSGTAVGDLSVAINEMRKSGDEYVEDTTFVDVTTWEKEAENCAKYLRKGSPVLVDGRLKLDQWEGKGGEKRSKLKVVANRVHFLSTKKESEDEDQRTGNAEESEDQRPPAKGSEGGSGIWQDDLDKNAEDLPF